MTLYELCRAYLRVPESVTVAGQGDEITVRNFVPPLSPAEQAIFDELVIMAHFGVALTLAEWQSIKEDAAGLKAYLGVASPTAAQTAAATKAIIRVLGTIIRD